MDPNVELKMEPNGWVCPYFTQNWVKTTQHFSESAIASVYI